MNFTLNFVLIHINDYLPHAPKDREGKKCGEELLGKRKNRQKQSRIGQKNDSWKEERKEGRLGHRGKVYYYLL